MRAYTHGGWAHRQRVSITFFYSEKLTNFLALLAGFEPVISLDLQSDGLLTEPPRHHYEAYPSLYKGYSGYNFESMSCSAQAIIYAESNNRHQQGHCHCRHFIKVFYC